MTIRIHTFDRPDQTAVLRFAGFGSSVAANLGGRRTGLHHEIGRICGDGIAVGPALTAEAPPGDNLAVFAALSQARAGDVLILATGGGDECAVVGDCVANLAVTCGIAAIVTDGLVRDRDRLAMVGLPVHARGLSPNGPRRDGPAIVGAPVCLGRSRICAGDLIVADADGIAVVSRGILENAAAELGKLSRQDEELVSDLAAGGRYPAWLDPMLVGARRESA